MLSFHYNFPQISYVKRMLENPVDKVAEEARELREAQDALNDAVKCLDKITNEQKRAIEVHCIEEALDVAHAAETYLRNCNQDLVHRVYIDVIEKNNARGYYKN